MKTTNKRRRENTSVEHHDARPLRARLAFVVAIVMILGTVGGSYAVSNDPTDPASHRELVALLGTSTLGRLAHADPDAVARTRLGTAIGAGRAGSGQARARRVAPRALVHQHRSAPLPWQIQAALSLGLPFVTGALLAAHIDVPELIGEGL